MPLPIAPLNFYTPSLLEIQSVLKAANDGITGQVSLITAAPLDIENAWAEVGSGDLNDPGNQVGSNVVGVGLITDIIGPVGGPVIVNTSTGGYKLQFTAVPDIDIKIDGSGTTTAIVVGAAMLVGRALFGDGVEADVRYITKLDDLIVTDGSKVLLPDWELIINYAEEVV